MCEVTGKGKFYAKKCDVTKESDVIQIFEWIENTFGTLHILINNAGRCVLGSIIGNKKKNFFYVK